MFLGIIMFKTIIVHIYRNVNKSSVPLKVTKKKVKTAKKTIDTRLNRIV